MKLFHKVPPLDAPKQPGEVEFDTLQLTRLRWTAINFQNFVIFAMAVMVVSGLSAVGIGWANVHTIKHDANTSRDRDLGSLVGICAIQNVTRIEITNAFKRMNQAGFGQGVPFETRKKVFDDILEEFQQVDCKALVPKEDQVNLCLNYPTTIPTPGETTTPTTAQPACGQ